VLPLHAAAFAPPTTPQFSRETYAAEVELILPLGREAVVAALRQQARLTSK
jgi:hypothetical protein